MLEPDGAKVACPVLRGLGAGNGLRLLDYVLPECLGNDLVRGNDGSEGRGIGKKRKAICNELHKGSKFAFARKGANLPVVFHCMNGGKPINVRYSITLKSERLTDA